MQRGNQDEPQRSRRGYEMCRHGILLVMDRQTMAMEDVQPSGAGSSPSHNLYLFPTEEDTMWSGKNLYLYVSV